jgi:hypothetical protein
MPLRRFLISDTPDVTPRPDEVLVWVGPGLPPRKLAPPPRLVHASATDEAVAHVRAGPAVLRLALADPLPFLTALAADDHALASRAA